MMTIKQKIAAVPKLEQSILGIKSDLDVVQNEVSKNILRSEIQKLENLLISYKKDIDNGPNGRIGRNF